MNKVNIFYGIVFTQLASCSFLCTLSIPAFVRHTNPIFPPVGHWATTSSGWPYQLNQHSTLTPCVRRTRVSRTDSTTSVDGSPTSPPRQSKASRSPSTSASTSSGRTVGTAALSRPRTRTPTSALSSPEVGPLFLNIQVILIPFRLFLSIFRNALNEN